MRIAPASKPSAASWRRASPSSSCQAASSAARSSAAQQAAEGAGVVVLDVGVEQAEGREQAGRRRHDDAAHAELLRHRAGEHRAVAAEGAERVVARVAAALARDRADRPDHVGAGDLVGAVGGVLERQAERPGDPLGDRRARALGVEFQIAADQIVGVDVAEDEVGVGDRGLRRRRVS